MRYTGALIDVGQYEGVTVRLDEVSKWVSASAYDAAEARVLALQKLVRGWEARVLALTEERDQAIVQHGMESGFWGRAAARATTARREAEAERDRLRAALREVVVSLAAGYISEAAQYAKAALDVPSPGRPA